MKSQQALRVELSRTPLAAATNAATASIDMSGAHYATILVPVGIEANTNSTNVIVDILHSDTTVVTSHVSLGTVLLDNAAASCQVYHCNWIGKGRYMRVTATPDTTTNGTVLLGGIIVVKQVDASPNASTTAPVTIV